MQRESYDPPAVEDRTPVEEPLNTTVANSERPTITPSWRERGAGTDEA
jgi:hypothetical protein